MPGILNNLGFVLTILVLFFVCFLAWVVMKMKNKNQIHYAFLILLATSFVWIAGSVILEYDFLNDHETRKWAIYLAYIGVILTPVAVLFIGLIFANTKIKFTWKYALLLIVPLVSLMILFTNDLHNLFYLAQDSSGYLDYMNLTKSQYLGRYFTIHTLYSYLCITVGMGYLIYFTTKNAGFFSRQSVYIFLGIIISFSYNILLTVQIIQVRFNTNVIAFFFTLLLFFFAIFKFDFLNIVPIALQKVVDHISDSFMVIDKDLYVIDYNKTFTDAFGSVLQVNRKDNLNQIIERTASGNALSDLLVTFRESIAAQIPQNLEKHLVIEGEDKYYSVEITPLYNQNIYLSTIILLKDITDVKKAMDTIQKNSEILMEKERLASLGQLIGGIAHNLKTPIMSISGGIEGLRDLIGEYEVSIGDPTVSVEDHHEIVKEMREWIDKIKPYCSYMSDIITTVKGQAAQFNTATTMTFTLDELVKRVELLMKHELNRFHCILEISFQTDQLIEMKGEVNSLVQIFDNMIINSIHAYNGKSGVIELNIKEEGRNVVFALKDHGLGMSPVIKERLFKEMVTTKGKNGTGLGLYMSYATIKGRFDGKMWFESEPGSGTTFYISIPFSRIYRNEHTLEKLID